MGALLVAALCGACGEPTIEHYQVKRPARLASPPTAGLQGLLGAVIPHGDRTWYLKLSGPKAAVSEQQAAFERFVRSVRFVAGERPMTWEVPQGWHEHPAEGMRYAQFHIGGHDAGDPLELTVIPLSGASGSLLDNVRRWAEQIGAPEVNEANLATLTREIPLEGAVATFVDLEGSGGSRPSPARMAETPATQPGAPRLPYQQKVPAGWQEQPQRAGAFAVSAYRIEDSGRRADVTVTPLGGPAGGLVANVNRWRGQIGLAVETDQNVERDAQAIELSGHAAQYVDLVGPEAAGPERQRTLAVIATRDGVSWFFKMTGHADLVAQQKSAFEQWIASVQF